MTEQTPNTLPWPPMIYGGLVIVGLVLNGIHPIATPANLVVLGWAILVAGLCLDLWAMAVMAKQHTNILPHKAADRLVTSGPFAYMRNPIYVGNTIATVGLGLILENGWLIVVAPLAAILVHHLAVKREEAHLSAKFGDAWTTYCQKAKRWWLV